MAMKRKNLPELAPQVFEHEQFGSVRVVTIDGKPWFVGTDLCRALELENVTKALYTLADDEKQIIELNTLTSSKGIRKQRGNPNVNIVNESGLYRLIFASRKPEAEKFRHWVFHEVLPSIRETGSYSVAQYDFFHPSPEELERRSKITTIEGMIEDLDAHGIDWDWEAKPRIEIDENGDEHVVYRYEVVIKHPEYEKLQKQRIEAKKSAVFLSK